MALEHGEVVGIVNAVSDSITPLIDALDTRLGAVEMRVANIEPRVRGMVGAQIDATGAHDAPGAGVDAGRLDQLEQAVAELVGAVEETRGWCQQITAVLNAQSLGLAQVLAGGADLDVWRAYVTREAVRCGVGVKEYAAAVRDVAAGQQQATGQQGQQAVGEEAGGEG